jgi:hypothetical protein
MVHHDSETVAKEAQRRGLRNNKCSLEGEINYGILKTKRNRRRLFNEQL